MNVLPIKIAESHKDAPNYKNSGVLPGKLHSAIIVCGGMKGGKASVDLRFTVDFGEGKEVACVAMTTGQLLTGLAKVIQGIEEREA